MIDGFPRNLDQALVLENEYRDIDYILNFNCPREVLLERLRSRASKPGEARADDDPTIMEKRINDFYDVTMEAVNFYNKMGRVKNIDCQGTPEAVYDLVQDALKPNLVFVVGPTCVGKTTLSQSMARHMSYTYLNIEQLFKVNGWVTCEAKVKGLRCFMEFCKYRNFVLDGFPQTRKQAKIFAEHFCEPLKLLHLQLDKDEVNNRMTNNISSPKEIQQKTSEFNAWLAIKNDLISYVEKQPYYHKISALSDKDTIFRAAMCNFNPTVLMANGCDNPELASALTKKIEEEKGFIH